ncbi:hypothetical protein B0H11DRAFT_1950127 [Mycena galericulata]|nr:hypothetical protein B0H11DRAFT_1950127 [Mycena galericulata]
MPQKTRSVDTASLDQVVDYGIAACHALREVADGQSVPYLQAVAGISSLIMENVQRVRANKSQCMKLVAQIHEVLCRLIHICANFELDPSVTMLHHIANFTETLQKIHVQIQAQIDLGMFKRILKQAENASRLDDCQRGLERAIEAFGLQTSLVTAGAISQIHKDAARRHEEFMALVDAKSDAASSHVSELSSTLRRSASTLSLIPGSPKIFYGRDKEVATIVLALTASTPGRLAILGPGGMGKTALALAAMHDPSVTSAFGVNRFFVSLYAACSATDMIGMIARYFGVEQEGRPHKAVLRYLSALAAPILLVLDNLEDCWEPLGTRAKVEDFLSLLTEVPELYLVVTMRGAERPSKIKWTRPFLPVLMPLDIDAARSTFLDIVDEVADPKILDKVLALTDFLPLAISLMANLVSYEGCDAVLQRWHSESTALLSDGFDKLSNLDKSIMVSISSTRMTANPNALRLLGILALLPDGVSSADLEQMNLPLPDLARCTSTLMRCALTYLDNGRPRFRVLAPIREYVRQRCPPDEALRRPMLAYFYSLADLFNGPEFLSHALIQRISSDLGNLRSIALYAISGDKGNPVRDDLVQAFRCIVKLAGFTYLTTLGSMDGLDSLQEIVETLGDPQLCGQYLHWIGHFDHATKLEAYSRLAIQSFEKAGDLVGQAKSYRALALHYERKRDIAKAFETLSTSIALASQAGDLANQASSTVDLSQHYNLIGETASAIRAAREAQMLARASGNLWVEARAIRARATICERTGDYARGARLCLEGKKLLAALSLDSLSSQASVFRHLANTEAEISLAQTNYALARKLNMALTTPEEAQTGFSHQETSNGYALVNIAYIDIATGNPGASAGDTLDLAGALFTAHGSRFGLAACDITMGDLHFWNGEYAEARTLYLKSLAAIPVPELQTMCLEKLCDVALARNDVMKAQRCATVLLIMSRKGGYQPKMHAALRRLGDVFSARGDEVTALRVWEVALAGFTLMDIYRAQGECLLRIGDIQASRGDMVAARGSWESARPQFEKSLQRKNVLECDRRLGVAVSAN